jgi:hypothetical protein
MRNREAACLTDRAGRLARQFFVRPGSGDAGLQTSDEQLFLEEKFLWLVVV